MTAAIIMAGGKGLRLRPLTKTTPKPMLPVNGRPMLEWIVKRFVDQGITEIVISINYLGGQIENHFGNGTKFGADITYLRESSPLGTAGALSLLAEPTEPFITINGDILTSVNFNDMLRYHLTNEADITMGATIHSVEIPFGVLKTCDYTLSSIREKPIYNFPISAGINIISPAMLKQLSKLGVVQMPEFIESVMANGGKVVAFPISGEWADVGCPSSYEMANAE